MIVGTIVENVPNGPMGFVGVDFVASRNLERHVQDKVYTTSAMEHPVVVSVLMLLREDLVRLFVLIDVVIKMGGVGKLMYVVVSGTRGMKLNDLHGRECRDGNEGHQGHDSPEGRKNKQNNKDFPNVRISNIIRTHLY